MGLLELFFVAIGLSMDAFAVAICKGLNMSRQNWLHKFIVALFFGVFQAVMPLIGWLLGKQFESYISRFDHWIAFGLLILIGSKMIFEVFKKDDCTSESKNDLKIKELTLLAVATSIDALAVGVSFAFLRVAIVPAVSLIGVITFVLSLIAVSAGNRLGEKFKDKAELAGGTVLILIGTKILLDHLL